MNDQQPYYKDNSTSVLLNKEQQLKEEIAKLRKEEQELQEKDLWIKQNILAIKEKIASEKRLY